MLLDLVLLFDLPLLHVLCLLLVPLLHLLFILFVGLVLQRLLMILILLLLELLPLLHLLFVHLFLLFLVFLLFLRGCRAGVSGCTLEGRQIVRVNGRTCVVSSSWFDRICTVRRRRVAFALPRGYHVLPVKFRGPGACGDRRLALIHGST